MVDQEILLTRLVTVVVEVDITVTMSAERVTGLVDLFVNVVVVMERVR